MDGQSNSEKNTQEKPQTILLKKAHIDDVAQNNSTQDPNMQIQNPEIKESKVVSPAMKTIHIKKTKTSLTADAVASSTDMTSQTKSSPSAQTIQIKKTEAASPSAQTIQIKKPEVASPSAQTIQIKKPEAASPSAQTIQIKKPESASSSAQTIQIKKPESASPSAQTIQIKKPESASPSAQTIQIKKPESASPSAQTIQIKKPEAISPSETNEITTPKNKISIKKKEPEQEVFHGIPGLNIPNEISVTPAPQQEQSVQEFQEDSQNNADNSEQTVSSDKKVIKLNKKEKKNKAPKIKKDKKADTNEPHIGFLIVSCIVLLVLICMTYILFAQYMNMYQEANIPLPEFLMPK